MTTIPLDIKREKTKLKTIMLQTNLSLIKIKEADQRNLSISHIETFLSQYQVKSIIGFTLYLSEIWRDLSHQSTKKTNGISRTSFSKYFPLPGLINVRLFNIFDANKDNYLSPKEFIEGMTILFSESLKNTIKFIFLFYDFNNDGFIDRDDIRVVLSYIPVLYDFEAMVNLEEEVFNALNEIFGKKEKMNLNQFFHCIIDEENYELIIPIISFFYEKKPFNNEEIDLFYKNYINKSKGNIYEIEGIVNIEKIDEKKENKNDLIEFQNDSKNNQKMKTKEKPYLDIINSNEKKENKFHSNNYIIKIDNNFQKDNQIDCKQLESKKSGSTRQLLSLQSNIKAKTQFTSRNEKSPLKNKFIRPNSTPILQDNNNEKLKLMATSAGFLKFRKSIPTIINSCKILKEIEIQNLIAYNDENKSESKEKDENSAFSSEENYDDDEYDGIKFDGQTSKKDSQKLFSKENKYESYLYKLTPSSHTLKKLYFKLYNKDLFYFKTKKSKYHQGMHNLNGLFLEFDEENNVKTINNKIYYTFNLINPKKKTHLYLSDDIEIYEDWINILKNVTNYAKTEDLYIVKEEIGHGKFSKVYLGKEKKTNRKVAIKRINKKKLTENDLDLLKTEIDILRICQHPNIIKLYKIIETPTNLDLIMEYCPGGNLYYYLQKRALDLEEKEVAKYIHKISTAVYTMHNLGIIHRDLKLSNIVMTDSTSFADIRILDFGLSKILGPGEKCNESYGTPGYAAPEVIKENKYDFKADIWSIGVITYFLFSSKLPFNYTNKNGKKDYIKNTLEDEVKFDGKEWKNISSEGIKFIKDTMNKNVDERINIKNVLEHEWIKKYYNENVKQRRSIKNTYGYSKASDFRLYASIMKKNIEKVTVKTDRKKSNSLNNLIVVKKPDE